ncbi:MAG TPA: TlpA disulfide reductase family protein [Vicinamibacterales bacterium]|nr:TlpA disulfide reductase family protein [Vicinamibacterales bacterium]
MATPEDDPVAGWTTERLARLAPPSDFEPNLVRNRRRLDEQLTKRGRGHRIQVFLTATVVILLLLVLPGPTLRAVVQRCGEWLLTVSNMSGKPVRPAVPAFAVIDANGQPVALSTYRGKVVLLTVWTTTCGQCETERSWFTGFQDTYRDQGFVVLGVALDSDGWARVTPYLQRRPVNYQIAIGNRADAQSVLGASVPTTLILDREGRIAVRHVGYCSRSEFQRDIQKVLAE